MKVPPLVAQAEIAAMLGVSRQRVQQLVVTPAFPAPVQELAMGKVWLRSDVERWAAKTGRTVVE